MNFMALFTRNKKQNDPQFHNEDIATHGGYQYAVSEKFSSLHANSRLSETVLSAFDYSGKKVIDIGCGDGKYTEEIYRRFKPAEIVGVDPAGEAVKLASDRYAVPGVRFREASIYALPFPDGYFDIAVVRGVTHHLDRPLEGMKEAVRVSKNIVLTDPNGYNPGCKIIEKISPYHRTHKEMSYFPFQYNRWLREAGATVTKDYYILLVPMFFPEVPARFLARFESFFEQRKYLSRFFCGTHVRIAANNKYKN